MNTKFVSVIVCTYNRREMLRECLDSIFSQTYPDDKYEVVVVNDGSTDNTEEILREYQEKAKCKFKWVSQENSGISVAINKGIRTADGEIICFTADDCIVDKNWIMKLVVEYKSEIIGGVGGNLITYAIENMMERYTDEKKLLNQENYFDPIIGANISYSRDAIQKTGFIDESLMSCEDVDYGIRVRLNGYKIRYAPEAVISHKHHATLKRLLRQQHNYGRGYARMHKKYNQDYNPYYNMILIPIKICYKLIGYPPRTIKVFFTEDKRYYLIEPVIDILVFSSQFVGMFQEAFFGARYLGEKYKKKLEFLPEQSLNVIWKMVLSKIGL